MLSAQELILELKKHPGDMIVFFGNSDGIRLHEITCVTKIPIKKEKSRWRIDLIRDDDDGGPVGLVIR